jgi:hypothetical protein
VYSSDLEPVERERARETLPVPSKVVEPALSTVEGRARGKKALIQGEREKSLNTDNHVDPENPVNPV